MARLSSSSRLSTTHPEDARLFAEVKRRLAARFRHDREGYMNGKSSQLHDILRLTVAADT